MTTRTAPFRQRPDGSVPSLCARFDAIPPTSVLTVVPIYKGDDAIEEWIRLEVDGEALAALPRARFLDVFHAAVHRESGDAA